VTAGDMTLQACEVGGLISYKSNSSQNEHIYREGAKDAKEILKTGYLLKPSLVKPHIYILSFRA
jgi:hypothetical protein